MEPWDPGGSRVGLRSPSLPRHWQGRGAGSPCLRRREGGGGVGLEVMKLDLGRLRGELGALGSGLWSEGSKEQGRRSEQGSGDLVLGGHGPEWAESIWEAEQDSQREGQE